jgi:heptosyltransferase-1
VSRNRRPGRGGWESADRQNSQSSPKRVHVYYPAMEDRHVPDSKVSRILLVRPSALGDVARTVPALVTLRKAYPHAKIDWLVARSYTELLRHHPDLNDVLPFDRKRFGQMYYNPAAAWEALTWCRQLRKARYDLVVDLQGLLRSGIFTRITGAPRRIGFANAREGAAMAYTEKYDIDPQMHTVDRMLTLLASAGMTLHHDMTLYPGQADVQWVREYLDQHGGADAPYACIAPTAQWLCKCWPLEHYTRTARRLLEMDSVGRRVVVIAAPHEQVMLQPMLNELNSPAVLMPKMNVGQMLAMLSRTSLLVCNDSGPLHMAVGLNRAIVSIFGPTDPAVVGPYRRMETVVSAGPVDLATQHYFRHNRQDQSLISKVTPEAVWEKIDEQLATRAK